MVLSDPLQQLHDLDKTSAEFPTQLSHFLRGNEYQDVVPNLQGEDLVWLVEYLNSALADISDPASVPFQESLHELRKICSVNEVLPKSCTLSDSLLGCVYEGIFDGSKVRIRRVRMDPRGSSQKVKEIFHQVTVVWKHLAHPNLVPLLGVTTDPFQLISDWMPGGDLTGYITSNPDADRVGLLSDVAEGLNYLHSCTVVHGDLKGSNILVDATGRARITDFGLAMVARSPDSVQNGEVADGQSVRWVAPEILDGRGTFSKEADVFSFAMVTIEAFTGVVPFSDKSPRAAMLAIVDGERPPRPTHHTLTDKLWTLTQRCWNQETQLRPQMLQVSCGFGVPAWRRLIDRPVAMDERISLITDIFSDRDETEVVRHLCGDDAQTFVNIIDEMLDTLEPWLRRKCLTALCRICGRRALLPRSVQIPLCYDRMDTPLYHGGFAEVWKGEHQGREVAVKVLKVYLTSNLDKIMRRFCKEVVTWKALCHQNVLPLLGVTMSNKQFAMVSEWMDNGNINEFIKTHKDVNRFELLKDVVQGLVYMHGEGMIHGDLKGANILINQHGHACLADFGLIAIASDPAYPTTSTSSANAGTTRWMSPELLDPDHFGFKDSQPTKESDCYALGMVIYEVLGRQAPFTPYKDFIVIRKVIEGERPGRPQGAKGVWFMDDLWGMLEQCWSPQPKDRPTITAVLECLELVSAAWQPPLRTDSDTETDTDDETCSTVSDPNTSRVPPPLELRVVPSQPSGEPDLEEPAGTTTGVSLHCLEEHPSLRTGDPVPEQEIVGMEQNDLNLGDGDILPGLTAQPSVDSTADDNDSPAPDDPGPKSGVVVADMPSGPHSDPRVTAEPMELFADLGTLERAHRNALPEVVSGEGTPVSRPLEPMSPGTVSKATTSTTATITTTNAITVGVHNNIAFISPPTTPTAERPLRSLTPTSDLPPPMRGIFSNRSGRISPTDPANSRTDLSVRSGKLPPIRGIATSPYPNKVFADSASMQQTVRSNTPYSQSNSSRIMTPASWSEHTEVDLVANLGSRERTRQEVLFEIVSSEERYVAELAKMKETFIDPLLHPFSATPASPQPSTQRPGTSLGDFKDYDEYLSTRPSESLERFPIASRFISSPVPGQSATPAPESTEDEKTPTQGTRILRKLPKSSTPDSVAGAIPPRQLPEDLRICLEVIENDLLEGHVLLSKTLKKRYEEQYPLVRSLADIFVSSSHILTGYAKFILHLERALEQVDNAMKYASGTERKLSKKQEDDQLLGVYLERLEENAAEKGETGLAISLSKPFQRLLKYPLMFQNLLFHTDPSAFEYESTLQMVAEAETIVQSIEDEKILKEERDRTRDILGRVDGLDRVKQLAVPKPSRVLMEERMIPQTGPSGSGTPPSGANRGKVKGKTTFKRLSDVLLSGSNGIGSKRDLWLVVFNDVVLRCQRTATTTFPIGSVSYGGTLSPASQASNSKFATTDRRNSRAKPRNLYKFLKIETWDIDNFVQLHEGAATIEIAHPRTLQASVLPRSMLLPDDDEDVEAGDSDDSTWTNKLCFFPYGADRVVIQKPIASRSRRLVSTQNGVRRGPASSITTYGRESSANAKFGTRLLPTELTVAPFRPSSRRTGTSTVTVATDGPVRSRPLSPSRQPRIMPLADIGEDEETGDSDDSGKRVTSFSYSGADKITLQKPITSKPRQVVPTQNGVRREPMSGVTTYNRESSANTKFSTRPRSPESTISPPRPLTRRPGAASSIRRPANGDTAAVKDTVTRPAWDPVPKRSRFSPSRPYAVVPTRMPNDNTTTEPSSPSEDSGVGMYRQLLAKDPSLTV